MNLVRDPWLPTDSGTLRPADALHQASQVRWGRGDWDVASRVMLAGLLQTAIICDPKRCADEDSWEALLEGPPSDLDEWLEPFAPAFDGPVFEMPVNDGEQLPIHSLLPEAPGASTMDTKLSDIASWLSAQPKTLTEPQARVALYSDALWGTRWGRGHRQGTRGESRMLTLVEPETPQGLWQRVWLNVMPRDRWVARYGNGACGQELLFPWTGTLRKVARPKDSPSALVYWAMPRRVRLVFEGDQVVGIRRTSGGTEYEGWRHPMTPYVQGKEQVMAVRINPGHLGYADWAGIATLGRKGWMPATVVNEFIERHWSGEQLRLRVCGWSLGSSGEAGAWVEQAVPLLVNADPTRVEALLETVEKVRSRLDKALRRTGGKVAALEATRLYDRTESRFYDRIQQADDSGWELEVRRQARRLYDEVTDKRPGDPVEVARQRVYL